VLLARVAGQVWGAKQAERLRGWRLLTVRPLRAATRPRDDAEHGGPGGAGHTAESEAVVVAADRLGAGPGELVLVAHGSRCRDLTLGEDVPTKDVVIAIVDDATFSAGTGGAPAAEAGPR
jgi:microcompartment protein CcmK/EutM